MTAPSAKVTITMLTTLLLGAEAEGSQPKRAARVSAAYTGELWHNVRGGIDTGGVYLDNLTLAVELDADALWGGSGVDVLLEGLYNNGNSLSGDLVGDLQTVSNIESGLNDAHLYQALIEALLGDRASLRLGLYDLNSEFDVLESADLFIHSAHGIGTDIGQSGENGPSIFPVTSLGARFAWSWNQHWTARAAVLDGVPGRAGDPQEMGVRLGGGDGALLALELERSAAHAKLLLGTWGYTAATEEFGIPGRDARSAGAYVRGEWQATGQVAVFARWGWAREAVNPFGYFAGGGLNWRGPVAGRPDDRFGVAVAWADASSDYRRSTGGEPREVALEITYRMPLGERLVVQPDLQYVIDPGLDPTLDDALSLGLRVELTLN